MDNYYNEMLLEVKRMIEDNELEDALAKVNEELKMPYVPEQTEKELLSCKQTIKAIMNENKGTPSVTIEKIEEYLKGEPTQQMQAVAALFDMNLRSHIDIVSYYLAHEPQENAAALLIDALIDQEVPDEMTLVKKGISYTFTPKYCEQPSETDGFKEADQYLLGWFGNDNPSMYEMCLQLLIQETYLMLPLAYEKEEGLPLALGIAQQVCDLMNDKALYEHILAANHYESIVPITQK